MEFLIKKGSKLLEKLKLKKTLFKISRIPSLKGISAGGISRILFLKSISAGGISRILFLKSISAGGISRILFLKQGCGSQFI